MAAQVYGTKEAYAVDPRLNASPPDCTGILNIVDDKLGVRAARIRI